MNQPGQKIVSPPIPSASGAYWHGFEQLKVFFLELLLVSFIWGFIQIPVSWPEGGNWSEWESYVSFRDRIFALAYWAFIATPIEYGIYLFYLKAMRGENLEFKTIITGFNRFVDVIFSRILVTGIIAIGILMLIIPGIIFAIRLSMVPYLVMDKNLDAIEAVKESWRLTEGHGWDIFGMCLLAIPLFIAGIIVFIVGAIIAVIWIQCAFASMYFALTGRPIEEETQQE